MRNRSRKVFIAVCIIPTLLLLCAFMIYPMLRVVLLSFTNAAGTSLTEKFIGIENYTYMFRDEVMGISLKNTFFVMIAAPMLTLVFSMLFAVLLTQNRLKEKNFYRTLFFFPSMLSMTVIGILWSFIYHPNSGIINTFLRAIGLEQLERTWLGDSRTVMWAIVATLVWQAAGYYMVMYIAGIESIPPELYEAAMMDGATLIQKFIGITMPFLWEIIRVTIVLCIASTLNISFLLIRIMTAGGPANDSNVLLYYMYEQAFGNTNFGYAMAIAVVTIMIGFGLSLLSHKLTEKETIEF